MTKNRLSKILASAGVDSRRSCEEIIFAGRVKVNGDVVKIPQTQVDLSIDKIVVDGKPIQQSEEKVYYLLNKPRGYVCSTEPGKYSKSVYELFEECQERIFTVGRLDKDTTGLLIVTNDGHFANRVIHPSNDVKKEYLVKTDQDITHEHLVAISNGAVVEGVFVKPVRVSKVRNGTIKVTIAEGKKREIRVLMQAVGLDVKELTRIRIGGLHLGKLPLGAWRELTPNELKSIFSTKSDET